MQIRGFLEICARFFCVKAFCWKAQPVYLVITNKKR